MFGEETTEPAAKKGRKGDRSLEQEEAIAKNETFEEGTKEQESGPPLSEGELSMLAGSDDSAVTSIVVINGCVVDTLVVSVRIDEGEDGNRNIHIFVSRGRPDTQFGQVQGDHVTAYSSFVQVLFTACEGKALQEASKTLIAIGKALLPEQQEIFNQLERQFQQQAGGFPRAKRKALTRYLREQGFGEEYIKELKDTLVANERHMINSFIERTSETILRQLNLEPTIAFKRVGEADRSQGSQIKVAMHALKFMNEVTRLARDDISVDIREATMERVYDLYLAKGAKYKDGFNAVQQQMQSGMRLPDRRDVNALCTRLLSIYNPDTGTTNAEEGIEIINELKEYFSSEVIAGFFGDLFDYPYEAHGKELIGTLYQVVARHLVIMFLAFRELDVYGVDEVIRSFLGTEVLEKAGWKEERSYRNQDKVYTVDALYREVSNYASLAIGSFSMNPTGALVEEKSQER